MRKTKKRTVLVCVSVLLLLILTGSSSIFARDARVYDDQQAGPVNMNQGFSAIEIPIESRIVDMGRLWLTITNYGFFGNDSPERTATARVDECTGEWSPQAEFPGGSQKNYLYRAGLWIGSMIKEEGFEYARVTTGTEGWTGDEEMLPSSPITERSTRSGAYNCLGDYISHEEAVAEQEFFTSYADTSTVQLGGAAITDPADGPHVPLGVEVTQKVYAWSYNYAQDFIIIDFELENIADKFLKNLYIGLYVDADVQDYSITGNNEWEDDICGFIKNYIYLPPGATVADTLTINTAWIADNDGRRSSVGSGSSMDTPDVTGTRVVRAPNPRLRTSFNWWNSNGDVAIDFGPAWVDDLSDSDWTNTLGTPIGDSRKYDVLGNGEFDYDQIHVADAAYKTDNPQIIYAPYTGVEIDRHEWRHEPGLEDVANGYDTRYMISWGPLGIYDYTDQNGESVFRLNPGEKFSMTIAYVAGEAFHDSNNPQPTDQIIDENLFNFSDFQYNADWASKVYDNPMIDTENLELGYEKDGWFGEDVGRDGVYAEELGEVTFYDPSIRMDVTLTYNGPDEGEKDGRFQPTPDPDIPGSIGEDRAPRPKEVDYTFGNDLFDQGDGYPDFQGPPPPEVPTLTATTDGSDVILKWDMFPSEDPEYKDPFSRIQDFEGYKIYVSNTGQEREFSFLEELDIPTWAYYSASDSLLSITYYDPTGLAPRKPFSNNSELVIEGFLKPIGLNSGFDEITAHRQVGDTTSYQYRIKNSHGLMPLYYCVTAYDFGDYKSGTESLESARAANSVYVAPDNDGGKKPGVCPNPYRADENYAHQYLPLMYGDGAYTSVSWENRNDGNDVFYPQTDRRIYFYNLPEKCVIRIFTVAGDLVQILDHDQESTNRISRWNTPHAEAWDLNSRNLQQAVSGLYLFSVEDKTTENKGNIDVGKFVIIR
jgi:hypothetical protein